MKVLSRLNNTQSYFKSKFISNNIPISLFSNKQPNNDSFYMKNIDPYVKLGRYDKPIGWILLFLPCTWGLTAGYPLLNLLYLKKFAIFLTGSVIMRACGCGINDSWDQNFDKKVDRTKDRPLASGKLITSQAITFISLHFLAGFAILSTFNLKCILIGLGTIPIIVIYPLMKRITNMPQLILGVCFNIGIPIGYCTILELSSIFDVLPLYLSGILWTLIYDTIYAHMDKKDDAKVGIKGTALYFAHNTKKLSILFYFLIYLLVSYYIENDKKRRFEKLSPVLGSKINILQNKDLWYPYVLLTIGTIHQLIILSKTDLNNVSSCLKAFKKSSYFGIFITLTLMTNNIINNELIESTDQIK